MGRKSKAKDRRKEILSHFYDVIIDEGFEGASFAKVARRMDVNPSLLVHYFSSKDAMVLGLIDHVISTYSAQILPDFSKVENPAERWDDVVDVVSRIQWDLFLNSTVFYSAYTLSLRNEDIRQQFVELYAGVRDRLEEEISHASQAGIIDVIDTRRAAELIITLMEGTNFYRHVWDDAPSPEERRKLLRDTLTQMFQSGKV